MTNGTTTTTTTFERAVDDDKAAIWQILQGAIARRKADGSTQWQDGYPNPAVVDSDLARGAGHVLRAHHDDGRVVVVGYVALWIGDEPNYDTIDGAWLTSGDDFVVFHRVAIDGTQLGKGYAQALFDGVERFARDHGVGSVRADTILDNASMQAIFAKRGYVRCGVVQLSSGPREAFEKRLAPAPR